MNLRVKMPSIVLLSLAICFALSAEDKVIPFKPGAASSYEAHQKIDDLVIAIKAYDTAELAKEAFGKFNPNELQVLPVLLIIENNRKQAIRVDGMKIEYILPGVGKIEPSTVPELLGVVGPSRPKQGPSPLPIPLPRRGKKNPFNAPEIEQRGWAAKVIAPGESAHGFFYFQTRHRASARLYLNGIFEPATQKELFYFEIPFTK
jgi:hypothetical protein